MCLCVRSSGDPLHLLTTPTLGGRPGCPTERHAALSLPYDVCNNSLCVLLLFVCMIGFMHASIVRVVIVYPTMSAIYYDIQSIMYHIII